MKSWSALSYLFGVLCLVMFGACTVVRTLPEGVPRFADNGDGTITDNATRLMWEAETGNGGDICLFRKAQTYAENLQLGGHTDWRLPSLGQLETLLDENHSPRINPVFECKPGKYWTRSKGRYKQRLLTRLALDFRDGEKKYFIGAGVNYYVRAVRKTK